MVFWVTVIVAYSIFISIYTSLKEDGHYKLFDEKVIEKNKKISYESVGVKFYVVAIVLRISSK